MPSRPPTLYCDEDVSVVLAAMLRARGFPVTTTRDAGYLGRTDEQPLHVASDAHNLDYRVEAFSIALMLSATIPTSWSTSAAVMQSGGARRRTWLRA